MTTHRFRKLRIPKKINARKTTPRYIIFRLQNIKDKILKEARGEDLLLQRNKGKDRLHPTAQKPKKKLNYLVLRGKSYQPRILYSAKLSFKCKGEVDFQTNILMELVASRAAFARSVNIFSLERRKIIQVRNSDLK